MPPLPPNKNTILEISGITLGNYSVRALKQNLSPLDQAKQVERSINGVALDFSASQFRKFKSSISCTDHEAPELTDIWPGKIVTVTSLDQLLGPDPVSLSMMIMGWSVERDEWNATTGWTIDLEQV